MITKYTLEQLNSTSKNTLVKHLGIEYTELGEDYICGKMPVDNRTKQPAGILHGGASGVLIETITSIASNLLVRDKNQFAVGLELNVNHIKSASNGYVYAKAIIVHKGRTTHVWKCDIVNEENKLIATGRMTMLVRDNN